ncbi:MAG TPA: ATP-binding protein [Polyangia bacterium]
MAGEELAALERRIEELESELGRAREAMAELTGMLANGASQAQGREDLIIARTRELAEKTEALSQANRELKALAGNLDKIVQERTHALADSEAQLRRKNAELDRLNRLKSEFISIAAHEFRTPMTSIVGYLDLISQGRLGPIPEAMRRPMASLSRNSQRLKHLIDDMLDVSRLDAGRMVLHRAPRDLRELVRSAVAELETFAQAKEHHIETDLAEVPLIEVDGEKIHQVISNLLANAIKYTPEGGRILLSVLQEPEALVLRVRDNGMGIPAAARDKLFEPFSEITAPQYHSSAGPDSAGLGLYIARGIVQLHGGEISVESQEGAYTEFSVALPLTPRPQTDAAALPWPTTV